MTAKSCRVWFVVEGEESRRFWGKANGHGKRQWCKVSAICRGGFGKGIEGWGAYSAGYTLEVVAPLVGEPAHDVEECGNAEGDHDGGRIG